MADKRKRQNIVMGAPDVAAGAFELGIAATAKDQFPKTFADKMEALKLKPGGYLSEDGVTKTVDISTEKVKSWNLETVVQLQTDYSVTLKLVGLEFLNPDMLKFALGDGNVEVANGKIRLVDNAAERPHRSMVFRINGGDGKKLLLFVPDAQVSALGDVQFVKSSVVRLDLTVEAFPVDGENVVTIVEDSAIKVDTGSQG
ncbi:hypothetical protein G7Y31_06650 [Corynebacterium lizhenjunii]|uniref:Phage tail protein n=1 Tax=Corynebacterium lizhenjunii TaxID=2709394 RepID=A0A7T0KDT9_9CORY|nr:hypothetical protein [Corynebacterium lizhenjunii]QPK78264.1 hypothetical protein G7Y31_06650 [Corynebacterium lizhenjunii]